jgi:hypothetical protein
MKGKTHLFEVETNSSDSAKGEEGAKAASLGPTAKNTMPKRMYTTMRLRSP